MDSWRKLTCAQEVRRAFAQCIFQEDVAEVIKKSRHALSLIECYNTLKKDILGEPGDYDFLDTAALVQTYLALFQKLPFAVRDWRSQCTATGAGQPNSGRGRETETERQREGASGTDSTLRFPYERTSSPAGTNRARHEDLLGRCGGGERQPLDLQTPPGQP